MCCASFAAKAAFCGVALFVTSLPLHTAASESQKLDCPEDADAAASSTSLLQLQMRVFKPATPPAEATKPIETAGPPGHPSIPVMAHVSSAAQLAAEILAAARGTFIRWTKQSSELIVTQSSELDEAERWTATALAVVAVFITLGMSIFLFTRSEQNKSIFAIVAHPIVVSAAGACRKAKRRQAQVLPPWESQPPTQLTEYKRSEVWQDSKIALKAQGKKSARAGKKSTGGSARCVALPRLCPSWEGGAELAKSCAVIDVQALTQLRTAPVDILDTSGKKVLTAAVRDAGDGLQRLELNITGQEDGPHAVIRGVSGSGPGMEVFGHKASQPYFNLLPQAGGGCKLLRAGQDAMLLQAGFHADLRIMALNAEGDFLASGGRYLGVRRGPDDVWKLRLCSGVDCLLIISCMLATILTHQPTSAPQPVVMVDGSHSKKATPS